MDENKTIDSATNVETTDTEFDAVQAINELKQNSVSKSEYEKVKAENQKYLKALIDGSYIDSPSQPKQPVDIDGLRTKLFKTEMNNLDYCKTALELRDAIMDKDGVDIFVAKGSKINPTEDDYEAAQRVADVFQSCIDVADGDSEIFTRELMRRTNDSGNPRINPKIKR